MHVSAARPLLASSVVDSVAGAAQVVVQQARSGGSSGVVSPGVVSSGASATPARVRIQIAAAGRSPGGPRDSSRYVVAGSATQSTLRSYLNELALGRN